MKTSTRDQVEGKLHEVKGQVKETVGELINDPYLEVEGNAETKEAGCLKTQTISTIG